MSFCICWPILKHVNHVVCFSSFSEETNRNCCECRARKEKQFAWVKTQKTPRTHSTQKTDAHRIHPLHKKKKTDTHNHPYIRFKHMHSGHTITQTCDGRTHRRRCVCIKYTRRCSDSHQDRHEGRAFYVLRHKLFQWCALRIDDRDCIRCNIAIAIVVIVCLLNYF